MKQYKRETVNLTAELEKIRKDSLPVTVGYSARYYAHHDVEFEERTGEESVEYIYGIPQWTREGWAIRRKLSNGNFINVVVDVYDCYDEEER